MREITRTALVPYSPAQMFALVEDFARYPQFVPWVSSVQVLERGEGYVIGRLEMQRAGIHEHLTTRVTLSPSERIEMDLVDGPFKTLHGVWTFVPIQDRGAKVGLQMQFEFTHALANMLLGKSFEKLCSQLVDAFVQRARELYDGK
ncbi:MAG: type II toxin-antitoxin system RatA family toxin [Steroidobacteraceae bacterium]